MMEIIKIQRPTTENPWNEREKIEVAIKKTKEKAKCDMVTKKQKKQKNKTKKMMKGDSTTVQRRNWEILVWRWNV